MALRASVEEAHAAMEAALSSGASDDAIVALEQAAQAAEQAYEEALAAEAPTAMGGAAVVPAAKGVETEHAAAAGGMWSDFKTLESLSWCVDESGALRPLDAGDCKARRVDQLVLLNAATRHVQETLIGTHGFSAIPLPLDGDGPVGVGQRCTVFASENWTSAEKLLIVVQPMSGQRRGRSRGGGALPGIWSRGLLLDRGMHGSMLAVVEGASADGWGVILCDPNTPSEGNESPEAHMAYVWERLVLAKAAASDVAFLAFSNGGAIVKSLLTAHEETIIPRCRALALIESSHRLVGELSLALEPAESKGLVRFLQKRTVNWQCVDPAAVGRAVPQLARVPEIEEQLGCVTLSAVPAEQLDSTLRNIALTIDIALPSVLRFLRASFTRRIGSVLFANEDAAANGAAAAAVASAALQPPAPPSSPGHRKKSGIFVSGVFSWINKPKRDKAAAAKSDGKRVAAAKAAAAAAVAAASSSRPGESVMDGLEIIKCVGKGAFGKVLLVRSKEDESLFALKILSIQHVIDKKQIEHTITERKIMVQIEHSFIAKLRFTFMSEGKLYFGMDFYAGGPLFYHLQCVFDHVRFLLGVVFFFFLFCFLSLLDTHPPPSLPPAVQTRASLSGEHCQVLLRRGRVRHRIPPLVQCDLPRPQA